MHGSDTYIQSIKKINNMKIIYCLFGIDNEYNQPKNNLICAWDEKPSHEDLKDKLKGNYGLTDVKVNNIRKKGIEMKIEQGGTTYRLEKIELGKKL